MFKRIFLFIFLSCSVFSAKIPESTRIDFALRLHRGFCLQSMGHSGAAATIFNDAYRHATMVGIPAVKLAPIGNLFKWYRKYGRYLGLFEATGTERITDEYWLYSNSSRGHKNKEEKRQEAEEIAEISRDMIFGVAEIIGGLFGIALVPEFAAKIGAGFLGGDGLSRLWSGFNRLKTKNDAIALETKLRIKEIEAANAQQFDW